MGAYVKLLEYDNIDGMILLSELSRRRIRSIQKLIRVGRNEVVVVLRVDKEKGKRLTQAERFGLEADLDRIYRFVETTSIARRYCEMRRTIQQEQDGSLDHATRCREDPDPHRDLLRQHSVAAEQAIWPRHR